MRISGVELNLPTAISTRHDLAHVYRELRNFYDMMIQSVMRHENPVKYPPISDSLRQLAIANQLDLRDERTCEQLIEKLGQLKSNAPSIHISFPVEPSREALDKLIGWLRTEVDKSIVISVGLQPSIAVGIVVRTPNRQFDFSLRKHLENSREKLKEAISSVE